MDRPAHASEASRTWTRSLGLLAGLAVALLAVSSGAEDLKSGPDTMRPRLPAAASSDRPGGTSEQAPSEAGEAQPRVPRTPSAPGRAAPPGRDPNAAAGPAMKPKARYPDPPGEVVVTCPPTIQASIGNLNPPTGWSRQGTGSVEMGRPTIRNVDANGTMATEIVCAYHVGDRVAARISKQIHVSGAEYWCTKPPVIRPGFGGGPVEIPRATCRRQ